MGDLTDYGKQGMAAHRKATTPVIDMQPQPQPAAAPVFEPQVITQDWAVNFHQEIPLGTPVNREQYLELLRQHVEWMKKQFIVELQEYPRVLAETLRKYNAVQGD